jgi:hypothetical protein
MSEGVLPRVPPNWAFNADANFRRQAEDELDQASIRYFMMIGALSLLSATQSAHSTVDHADGCRSAVISLCACHAR